jgi:hypothetical protein
MKAKVGFMDMRSGFQQSNIVKALDIVLGEASPTYAKAENITVGDVSDHLRGQTREDRSTKCLAGGPDSYRSSWAFVAEAAVGTHFLGSVTRNAATHADVAFAIYLFAFGDWAVAALACAAGLEVRAMAEPDERRRLVDADPGDLLATLGGGG